MTELYILNKSFKFYNVDFFQKYGIRLRKMPEDYLLPELRNAKKVINQRSGMYDYGAKYYNERVVGLSCMIDPAYPFNNDTLRELAYDLSKKGQLRLWNCPLKYYIGRIYSPVDVTQELKITNEFSLDFICDPFAYGNIVEERFNMTLSMRTTKAYKGTVATPTRIEITNPSASNATNIQITIAKKQNL